MKTLLHATCAAVLLCDPRLGLAANPRPQKEIVIGIEYAMPGVAQTFAALGVPAVKPYPDAVPWGEMQRAKDSAIDFTKMDRFVGEYQQAGFRELVLVLKAKNSWASKDPKKNFTAQPEFAGRYEAWVRAVVGRYTMGSRNAMPGLKRSVRYFEIGSEFSTFEPTPTDDYLAQLERAHKAAHAVAPTAIVLHAAFLVTTAFKDHPSPVRYAAAFANVDRRIMHKSLADIRKVLARPDIFDAVNFHSLGDAHEIEDTVAWLRHETKQRRYQKPIIISDTTPNPLIGWGSATTARGLPALLGVVVPPATEKDRPRLADYFSKLVDGDRETLAWTHAHVAADMVKKVVVSAEQGVALINTSFMEDLTLFKSKATGAGAGTSAWAGMADTKINLLNQTRTIQELRPSFFAIQQLQRHIRGYESVERIKTADPRICLYRFGRGKSSVRIAWLEPRSLVLPGDAVPTCTLALKTRSATLEPLIARQGQTKAAPTIVAVKGGVAEIKLTPTPVFIVDEP